jgi:hypothetical protein
MVSNWNEKRTLWQITERKIVLEPRTLSIIAATFPLPAQFREVSGYVHGVGGSPVHTADASGHKNLDTNEEKYNLIVYHFIHSPDRDS